MTSWIYLIIAGLLEVCWAIGLKYTDGFTKLFPSIFTIVTLVLSMFLLAKASQNLPIGTAYAAWVGIGAFGTAILGVYLFKEPTSAMRIIFFNYAIDFNYWIEADIWKIMPILYFSLDS